MELFKSTKSLGTHSIRVSSVVVLDNNAVVFPVGGDLKLVECHPVFYCIKTWSAHKACIMSVCKLRDNFILSVDHDGVIKIWPVYEVHPTAVIDLHNYLPTTSSLETIGVNDMKLENGYLICLTAKCRDVSFDTVHVGNKISLACYAGKDSVAFVHRESMEIPLNLFPPSYPLKWTIEFLSLKDLSRLKTIDLGQFSSTFDYISSCVVDGEVIIVLQSKRTLCWISSERHCVIGWLRWDSCGSSTACSSADFTSVILTPTQVLFVDHRALLVEFNMNGPLDVTLNIDKLSEAKHTSNSFYYFLHVYGSDKVTDFSVCHRWLIPFKRLLIVTQYLLRVVNFEDSSSESHALSTTGISEMQLFSVTAVGCSINHDASLVAVGDYTGQIFIFRVNVEDVDNEPQIHIESGSSGIRTLSWHPRLNILMFGTFQGQVRCLSCIEAPYNVLDILRFNQVDSTITSLRWSPVLEATCDDLHPQMYTSDICSVEVSSGVFNTETGDSFESLSGGDDKDEPILTSILLIANTAGQVTLIRHNFKLKNSCLDWSNISIITSFLAHHPADIDNDNFGSLRLFAEVWSSCWNPLNSIFFATSSEDQEVRVWKINNEISKTSLAPYFVLSGHRLAVTSVDWNQMDVADKGTISLIASCSDDQTVRLYSVTEIDDDNLSFSLLSILSTQFIKSWHTLTYLTLYAPFYLSCVTQNGYLIIWDLKSVTLSGNADVFGSDARTPDVVFASKIAHGSLEGLCWKDNIFACSSADCCLHIKKL